MDAEKATELLKTACFDLGLGINVAVSEVVGFRWTVLFEDKPRYAEFCKNMMKIERKLQEQTKRPIDLRLPRVPDKNKREERNVLSERKQSGG